MKNFLAIYLGAAEARSKWDALPEAVRSEREAAGIKAWYAWVDRNKSQIVDMGSPLGKTKSISKSGIADLKNNMTAFTIVRAESHEEAARLFENHPHFTIFPGESVEIMECLPIPGQ
jgi:hypothetical protein